MRTGGAELLLALPSLGSWGFHREFIRSAPGSHHTHQHVASPQSPPVAWLAAHWSFYFPAQLWLWPALRARLG